MAFISVWRYQRHSLVRITISKFIHQPSGSRCHPAQSHFTRQSSSFHARPHPRAFFTLYSSAMATAQVRKTNLQLIEACDSFPHSQIPLLTSGALGYWAFHLPSDPRPHGYIPPQVATTMPWTADFILDPTAKPPRITLSPSKNTASACSAALATLVTQAAEQGLFPRTLGRKKADEDFRIMGARFPPSPTSSSTTTTGEEDFVRLRRSATALFGIANRGAHMTVYTRDPAHQGGRAYRVWVPRRSRHLATYPGMLDNTVAGGVKAEETPLECIVHEAAEEASLPPDFVRAHARAVGAITYVTLTGGKGDSRLSVAEGGYDEGLVVPDVLYNYDLEVPAHLAEEVVPRPGDDEVEAFELWEVERVREAMARGEFKPNTAVALVDFLVRHGIVTEENEPDYVEIVARLHRRLHVPTSTR